MRGVYTASINIDALASSKTILLLRASSTSVIEVLGVQLSNRDNETNEQWEIGLYRTTTYGSPSGTSITPAKHEILDSDSVATALGDLSGEPTLYGAVLDIQGIASLGGYRFDPLPETRPIIPPQGAIGLRILNSPQSTAVSASITYREIG